MKQNIYVQKYFKIMYYLYQLTNIFNILVVLLTLICGDQMKCQKKKKY